MPLYENIEDKHMKRTSLLLVVVTAGLSACGPNGPSGLGNL